ncbi:MAG: DUF362 domain-containing protein [Syntrophales bacterium]
MSDIIQASGCSTDTLRDLLDGLTMPFTSGDTVGIKIHWGEKGNHSFMHPRYTRTIVRWLQESGINPFVFDTTVLYSGGRRIAADSLKTAAEHGFTEAYLGCPILIGDGPDARDVIDIPSGHRHFPTVQVASIVRKAQGFVIFSHFKAHMESAFGGAIKNISMGLASRAQKQRMHADAHPVLKPGKCTRCGLCADICPTGAAILHPEADPVYDLSSCVGCSQCIALCPQAALRIFWDTDLNVFQEKLVETAAALWREIGKKSLVINSLIGIVSECDCLPGKHPAIAADYGFIGGNHPLPVDEASIRQTGAAPFDRAHPGLPWLRQFSYAREIGFHP